MKTPTTKSIGRYETQNDDYEIDSNSSVSHFDGISSSNSNSDGPPIRRIDSRELRVSKQVWIIYGFSDI